MNRLKVIRAERRITQFNLSLLSGITQSGSPYFENYLLMPRYDEKRRLAKAWRHAPRRSFQRTEREDG